MKLFWSAEMVKPGWNAVYTSDGKKLYCINTIPSDKKIVMKLFQVNSEELIVRNRRCFDLRFVELGYLCLQS